MRLSQDARDVASKRSSAMDSFLATDVLEPGWSVGVIRDRELPSLSEKALVMEHHLMALGAGDRRPSQVSTISMSE